MLYYNKHTYKDEYQSRTSLNSEIDYVLTN